MRRPFYVIFRSEPRIFVRAAHKNTLSPRLSLIHISSIIATGSNAPVIVRYCRNRIVYDKYLLMEGLWNIYQRNK